MLTKNTCATYARHATLRPMATTTTPDTRAEGRRGIGQRLMAARKVKEFTRAELAEKIDSSAEAIRNYEVGKHAPGAEALTSLADVLGVSADYLLGRGRG